MRYLVTLSVDVAANDPDQAIDQAIAVVVSSSRVDGYDVDVEEIVVTTERRR